MLKHKQNQIWQSVAETSSNIEAQIQALKVFGRSLMAKEGGRESIVQTRAHTIPIGKPSVV